MTIHHSRRRLRAAAIILGVALAVGFTAGEALAFRMIQNTGVGRFSAGAAVQCNDAGGFVHWTISNIPFSYNTANQGAGKGTAFANAAASWTNVSGASHTVSIAGTTNAEFVTDGVNTLSFATGNGCTGGCLAITALVLLAGQVIAETDVSFNNAVTWTTDGSNYDTEAVAAHELGHCMGLHHTNVKKPTNRPTMYSAYFGSAGRTLESDDQQGLQCAQSRYPIAAPQFAARQVTESASRGVVGAGVALAARPRAGGAILRFALAEGADVRLQMFDVAGRLLTTLASGYRDAGEYEIAWDGGTASGEMPSGVYFARIQTASAQARATVILAE